MKRLFVLLLAMGSLAIARAQGNDAPPRLSAFTQQYMQAYKQLQGREVPVKGYVYKTINNKHYISAFIKVYADMDQSKLDVLGVFTGTKAGSMWTVQIPVDKVGELATINGINYIDLDVPVFPSLDAARKQTKADSAQKGYNLPMGMSGKNVVVGVIDAGFDFTHPTMYDTTHSQYRVKRVWSQKMTGTPPAGFTYGNEMTDTDVIRAKGYDTAILSHGTHVTGIAAGSGYGSYTNNRYRGMSYQSDIVLVAIMPAPSEWEVAGESDIIDGMNYIYNYAASVSEPAVINLSWGATIGPHDGYSSFSQACDGLTGPGKIFVCAAGNNGQDTVHLTKTFAGTDTLVSTFVTFSPYLDTLHQQTWVDVWGDTGRSFCINFKLYDTTAAIDSTPYLCISNTTQTYHMIGSNHDTCFVTITMAAPDYNGKPHAIVYITSRVHDNICMNTKGALGKINMWEGYVIPPEGYYGYLKSLGYPWAVSGDVIQTMSDIACTRSAISVGAYTSKTAFTNISGASLYYPGAQLYHIAPFSSLGPTEDYRVKPDITAPGFALASSINSYDTSYLSTGTNYNSIVSASTIGSKTYSYAMLAGTSMASPCAAGIVGLMLQLSPALTPDSVKSILTATAIKDTYTGTIPAGGSNTWGNGKINAYGACRYLAHELSVKNTLTADPLDCILYPNPNKGSFTIDYNSKTAEMLTVTIFDVTGKQVTANQWFVNSGHNSNTFSIAGLPKGVYFTRIASANGADLIKMVVE